MKKSQTFKLSFAALALGLVNSAWAADVACNSNVVSISEQQSASLSNCQITTSDADANNSPLTITNSTSVTVNNSSITLALQSDGSNGQVTAANITNSSATFNNVNINVTSLDNHEVALKAKDSNLTINGGSFTAHSHDSTSGEVISLTNTTAQLKDATISAVGDAAVGIELDRSNVTLDNVSITATDGDILQYTARDGSGSASATINNSRLTATGNVSALMEAFWSLSANQVGNVDLTLNNTTVNTARLVSAGGVDDENGTSTAVTLTEHINLVANDSQLSGEIALAPNMTTTNVINVALNNSSWTLHPLTYEGQTEQNSLTNLSLSNSVVNFENTDGFQTLTIVGNLTGSGTFNLNTNIAENKADKIVVQGAAEGNHRIGVTNSGANVADGKVTLVETNGGSAAFSLTNPNNRVDLGAYRYYLTKEGNNWVLAYSQTALNPTTNNSTTTNTNNSASVLPSAPELGYAANAQVSLRQSQLLLVEDELSGIHQRLGEVRNSERGNVWVRNVNSRQKLTGLSTGISDTSGFKQNVHSVQLGADFAANDALRIGGFVGRSQANVDFNNGYGSAKVRSNSVGLYATYLADNGIYLDNIVKYSRLRSSSDYTEKRHYNAYTLSSELGKQFKLANDWTLTPMAQLAWTHISGKDNEDSLASWYSRLGLRVAKGFNLSNGWNLQPYAQVDAITSRNRDSKIHYANAALDVDDSRGRFASALGINAGVANHRIGLEVNRVDGRRYDKPYGIQAVYRYQW